ncbi:MAG: PilN domain-containing protein [Candidatus Omnitrophica bacterium]|nr:PilN domain-containing protein [Candidatus Omnitrophota bacterium]
MSRNKKFLVLEIEDTLIKGAFIETLRGDISVKDIFSFARNKKEIKTAIKKLRGYRSHKKNTIVLIPSKKGMIRYLELPSCSEAELKDMINFQLPRYLPYSFNDIIFGFKVVQKKKEGYAKVMVACIQKKLFNDILKITHTLMDSLYGVFLCGEVGVDALPVRGLALGEAIPLGITGIEALVDISSEEVSLSIFDSSGPLFMRSLNIAFFICEKDWPKGLEELEKTFIAFGREFDGRGIDSIVITGAKAYAPNFYNFLKEQSAKPVNLFNPFDHVRCQEAIKEKFDNFSFHAVIGAAVDVEKKRINLISKETLSGKETRLKKRSRIHILLLVMIIIFQLSFILYKEIAKKTRYLSCLRSEIKKIRVKARAIEDKEKRASLIKTQLDTEGFSLDVLREVYRIIPANISINILIFEKDNSLSIRGTARTMAEVFKLIPLLEKSLYFDRVISKGTKMRKLKGSVVADFQIRAVLKE